MVVSVVLVVPTSPRYHLTRVFPQTYLTCVFENSSSWGSFKHIFFLQVSIQPNIPLLRMMKHSKRLLLPTPKIIQEWEMPVLQVSGQTALNFFEHFWLKLSDPPNCKILTFKVIFYVKNYPNLSKRKFHCALSI